MLLGLKISKMKILYFVFKLCKWPCFSLPKQKYKTKIAIFAPSATLFQILPTIDLPGKESETVDYVWSNNWTRLATCTNFGI